MGTYIASSHSSNRSGFERIQNDLAFLADGALYTYENEVATGVNPAHAALHGIIRAWDFLVVNGETTTPTLHAAVMGYAATRGASNMANSRVLRPEPVSNPKTLNPESSSLLYLVPDIIGVITASLLPDEDRDRRLRAAKDTVSEILRPKKASLKQKALAAMSEKEGWRTDLGQEIILGMRYVLNAEVDSED